MRETTATALRKRLFTVLEQAVAGVPTQVRYKDRSIIILSQAAYQALAAAQAPRKRGGKRAALRPVVPGKICQPLGDDADAALLDFLGL